MGTTSTLGTDTVTTAVFRAGTSIPVGGFYSLSFRNERTKYLAFDAAARDVEVALEELSTVGDVTVVRSLMDENRGFVWTVSFLTELGNVDMILFDNYDMTGTVVTGVVSELITGVAPPFNSLDKANGLPLGSAVITDLSELAMTISDLDEGIAYYIRVAAINSVGQGPFGVADVPFAIPEPQRPGRPENASLNVVDGTTLAVTFDSPLLD